MNSHYRRRSIRLQGYDYSQNGLYFLTICSHNKEWYFGEVTHHHIILSDIGEMVELCWKDIPNHFPQIILHEYVIMPNHIHGIIEICNMDANGTGITGANGNGIMGANETGIVGANNYSPLPTVPTVPTIPTIPSSPLPPPPTIRPTGTSRTVGSVVRGFKIGVTRCVGFSPWQRNYYEHIIRNDAAYQHISQYIENNPLKWKDDCFFNVKSPC